MSTRSIPAVSFRGSAGLPLARENARDRLQSLMRRVPSWMEIEYDRVETLDDLEFQIENEIDLAEGDGSGSITTPARMRTAKSLLAAVKAAPRHVNLGRPNVTDRALRYRANEEPPEGPEVCCFCGSRRFVEIDHVNGFEFDNDPANKMWLCRSCNTRKGIAMRNAGLGRRTHQYNPAGGARNLGQWVIAVMSAKGESNQMNVRDAVNMIRETSQRKRSEFAQEIWDRRRKHGTDTLVPF